MLVKEKKGTPAYFCSTSVKQIPTKLQVEDINI